MVDERYPLHDCIWKGEISIRTLLRLQQVKHRATQASTLSGMMTSMRLAYWLRTPRSSTIMLEVIFNTQINSSVEDVLRQLYHWIKYSAYPHTISNCLTYEYWCLLAKYISCPRPMIKERGHASDKLQSHVHMTCVKGTDERCYGWISGSQNRRNWRIRSQRQVQWRASGCYEHDDVARGLQTKCPRHFALGLAETTSEMWPWVQSFSPRYASM